MMDNTYKNLSAENYIECFGHFDLDHAICRKYCAVRLRCAVEQGEQTRMEQLEDWMAVQEMPSKIQ